MPNKTDELDELFKVPEAPTDPVNSLEDVVKKNLANKKRLEKERAENNRKLVQKSNLKR